MKSKSLAFLSSPAMVTALGNDTNSTMKALIKSQKNFTSIKIHDKNILVSKVNYELPKISKAKYQTRTNSLLLLAMLELENLINSAIKKYGRSRIGVVLGTTTSGIEENLNFFIDKQATCVWHEELFSFDKQSLANPSEFVRDFFALSSFAFVISTACTSGAKALMQAKRMLQANLCDCVICGGVDGLSRLTIEGFDSLGLLSEHECLPFSANRDGINIGEGACLFLLSKDEISNCTLSGAFSNNDAYHITKPETSAKHPIKLIKQALSEASLSSVDYINLHGTGTKANDKMEARAFFNCLPDVYASSTKSLLGHTLGAAGALEAGICAKLIEEQNTFLPLHVYDGNYDDELERLKLVTKQTKCKVKSAISSSFAFGGDNAILLLRSFS